MVTWISFAIGLVSSPLSTRLFLPAELARITQFNHIATLMASFCYLGLDQAFVRFFSSPPGGRTAKSFFTFCASTSLGFSILSTALLFWGWQSISARVVGQADMPVFLCLCVFSFCSVLFRYLSLVYRMEQNAKLYTIQGVLHVVLTKIAYLSIGFGSAQGRTAILFLTLLMGLFTLAFVWVQRNRFEPRVFTQIDRPFLREVTSFSAPLIPITIVNALNATISSLVLGDLADFDTVGIYASAVILASTVNIIQSGFNAYWAPYVYENYQTDNKRRFFTVHRIMACLLTLFGLTLTLLQVPVFWLLGEKYRSAVVFFPFLFLTPICYCLSETTGMGINIAKKTHWTTLIFLTAILCNLALSHLLIPTYGAVGAALAAAGAAILSLVLRTWAGERYYKAVSNYRYIAYTIGLLLASSFGSLLLLEHPIAKYALLTAVYALACFLFRREIIQLWQTALQVLREGRAFLARRAAAQNGGEKE